MTRLFHFSDDPGIKRFEPRPVRVPADRGPGRDWLNGPLVWAIDAEWQPMYLFPRECPRILLRRKSTTTQDDADRWWGGRECGWIAHIEWDWFERFRAARLTRYELPATPFESLHDIGIWVSREAVEPIAVEAVGDLPAAMAAAGVELRVMPSLRPLKGVWDTSLHASGIRLRNARDWAD